MHWASSIIKAHLQHALTSQELMGFCSEPNTKRNTAQNRQAQISNHCNQPSSILIRPKSTWTSLTRGVRASTDSLPRWPKHPLFSPIIKHDCRHSTQHHMVIGFDALDFWTSKLGSSKDTLLGGKSNRLRGAVNCPVTVVWILMWWTDDKRHQRLLLQFSHQQSH